MGTPNPPPETPSPTSAGTIACGRARVSARELTTLRPRFSAWLRGRSVASRMFPLVRLRIVAAMGMPLWTTSTFDRPVFNHLGGSTEASLVAENHRLRAAIAQQQEEVRRTKQRLVEAGDAARRRVERDLHDGAQQRIVALTLALRLARTQVAEGADPAIVAALDKAGDEARAALTELRELARGIHPATLAHAGLTPALENLAARATTPTVVASTTSRRFAEAVELAAYFLVSEALANASKHAGASRIDVIVTQDASRLIVEVIDDGRGGADPRGGTGLTGLADRIEAIGGRVVVRSPLGSGTHIRAMIPVSPEASVI